MEGISSSAVGKVVAYIGIDRIVSHNRKLILSFSQLTFNHIIINRSLSFAKDKYYQLEDCISMTYPTTLQ